MNRRHNSILLALIIILSTICAMGCSSKSEYTYKDYGYSVEDFYKKGPDGKWYPK